MNSSIDRFASLTVQTSQATARRARALLSSMGLVCVVLLLSLIVAVWRVNAMEQERDLLAEQLRAERAALVEARLAAKGVEMNVATYALETQVRRDIVDEQMVEQDRRSTELGQLAEQVEREKLVKADCVTPRSILAASGL